jgi:tryptophan 2,3-dioxygenase
MRRHPTLAGPYSQLMAERRTRENRRPIEPGVKRDLAGELTYGDYLCLDELLSAQRPLSDPEHHDELLFIVQHQTSELWMRLLIHELTAAMADLRADAIGPCLKKLARIKQIQRQLFEQWSVLETLTPTEYAQLRPYLRRSSGFQSFQYRLIEFLLGNKNDELLRVFAHDPPAQKRLRRALEAPSLYEEFIAVLSRRGHSLPAGCLKRDWSQPRSPSLVSSQSSVRSTKTRSTAGSSTRSARSWSTSRRPSSSGASVT